MFPHRQLLQREVLSFQEVTLQHQTACRKGRDYHTQFPTLFIAWLISWIKTMQCKVGVFLWVRSSSRNSNVSGRGNQSCFPGAEWCQGYERAKVMCWLTAIVKGIIVTQLSTEDSYCQPRHQFIPFSNTAEHLARAHYALGDAVRWLYTSSIYLYHFWILEPDWSESVD